MNIHRPVVAMLVLIAGRAFAQDTALLGCADIANRDERLACFDALAAKARAAKSDASTTLADAEKFGLDSLTGPSRRSPDASDVARSVVSRIDGVVEGWGPGTVFTLSNGQRWQVADGSSASLYLSSPKVSIKRAALGGYVIELEGTNKTARVKRFE